MRQHTRVRSAKNALALALILATAGMLLAGCVSVRPGSVKDGECKVFVRPAFVVEGKTRDDQAWIDDTIESGVAGCGWRRPKASQVK